MRLIAFWPCWRASGAGPPNKELLLHGLPKWQYVKALQGSLPALDCARFGVGRLEWSDD